MSRIVRKMVFVEVHSPSLFMIIALFIVALQMAFSFGKIENNCIFHKASNLTNVSTFKGNHEKRLLIMTRSTQKKVLMKCYH